MNDMVEYVISGVKIYLILGVAYFIATNIIYHFRKVEPQEAIEDEEAYQQILEEYKDRSPWVNWADIILSLLKAMVFLIVGWPYYLLELDQ